MAHQNRLGKGFHQTTAMCTTWKVRLASFSLKVDSGHHRLVDHLVQGSLVNHTAS